jgi:hypothetical protein
MGQRSRGLLQGKNFGQPVFRLAHLSNAKEARMQHG